METPWIKIYSKLQITLIAILWNLECKTERAQYQHLLYSTHHEASDNNVHTYITQTNIANLQPAGVSNPTIISFNKGNSNKIVVILCCELTP